MQTCPRLPLPTSRKSWTPLISWREACSRPSAVRHSWDSRRASRPGPPVPRSPRRASVSRPTDILAGLGYTPGEVEDLRAKGVFGAKEHTGES